MVQEQLYRLSDATFENDILLFFLRNIKNAVENCIEIDFEENTSKKLELKVERSCPIKNVVIFGASVRL